MIHKRGDILQGYKLEEEIGRGGTAIVWSVSNENKNGESLALKMFNPDIILHPDSINEINGQFYKQKGIKHPSILPPLDLLDINGVPAVLFEKADRSLYGYLRSMRKDNPLAGMSEDEIVEILLDISEGLEYLHSIDLAHNDVKTDNVLVFDKGSNKYRLCDLDTSVTLRATIMRLTTKSNEKSDIHFTPLYVAPEKKVAIARGGYSFFDAKKSDIFSLGVMAMELCTKLSIPPEQMIDNGSLKGKIQNLAFFNKASNRVIPYSNRFKCLLSCLLEKTPEERLPLNKLIEQLRFRNKNGYWDESVDKLCKQPVAIDTGDIPEPKPWLKFLIGIILLGIGVFGVLTLGLQKPNNNLDYSAKYDSVSQVVEGYACVCNKDECGILNYQTGILETSLDYEYCRISGKTIKLIKNDELTTINIIDNQLKY